MAKFKVGDKVRVKSEIKKYERHGGYEVDASMYAMRGKITTITKIDTDGAYSLSGYAKAFWEDWMIEPVREFIVIRRDGEKTIAELRHDRDVIKSGTATCNASDTFDFDAGAKLAFDRLMGRDEPQPEPPKFYTGKVVCVEWKGDFFRHANAGRIAIITNGISDYDGWNRLSKRFESFSDFCSANTHGVFHEIKE